MSGTRWASLEDAAAYLGVSVRTLRRMIAAGEITGYRLGRRLIRIDLNEVESKMKRIPSGELDEAE